jgi:hypothetical protein
MWHESVQQQGSVDKASHYLFNIGFSLSQSIHLSLKAMSLLILVR